MRRPRSDRKITTAFDYDTDTCGRYRVRATNPVGSSPYAKYNDLDPIGPTGVTC